MARKRGNNEGSIYRRSNGSWRAQVTLDGRRLSFTANTRAECQEWIRNNLILIDDGMTFISTQVTLQEYLADWLISKKPSIKYRTWKHYERLIRRYIAPKLGSIKIRDLQTWHIQNFYNQMLQQDVGVYTIRKVHAILHSSLSHALKLNMIAHNAASGAIKPKKPSKEMAILDQNQVSQMLLVAKGNRLEPILHLAVSTGMRQMELLGLKWVDLDPIKHTIKVERQLVRPVAGRIEFTSPKTKFGRRTIALGTKAMEVLRRNYERQNISKLAAGDMWTDNGLIFTNATGGPLHPRNLLRDFKKLIHDAGLPMIRFHDLRHTAASLMLNHNIPVLVVSRMLGHSRPSITLDVYGHLIPSAQAYVAEKMDELITPIEVTNCTWLHRVAPDFYPQPDL